MKIICDENDCRVKANEILSLYKRYMDIEMAPGELAEVSSLFEVWEIINIIM